MTGGRSALRRAAVAATVVAVAVSAGCGDDQPEWCDELESVGNLEALAAAIAAADGPTATDELEGFEQVAEGAPSEIRADMEAIADVLSDVVAVAMAGENADADQLELQRESANQRLAEIPGHVATVSGWAEEECGIRLD